MLYLFNNFHEIRPSRYCDRQANDAVFPLYIKGQCLKQQEEQFTVSYKTGNTKLHAEKSSFVFFCREEDKYSNKAYTEYEHLKIRF